MTACRKVMKRAGRSSCLPADCETLCPTSCARKIGTSGNMQGERKDTSPAPKARPKLNIVLHFWSPLHSCMGRKKWLSADRKTLHSLVLIDRLREPCYTPLMKQIITAKLKLHTTPAQFQALRTTQLAYRDALNYVSCYAFEHGKMSSGRALQRGCYHEIRLTYAILAQMACNVPRHVGATYKTLWTKVRQNAAHRKAGQTKKRYKVMDNSPKYVYPTINYNYHPYYSLMHVNMMRIV